MGRIRRVLDDHRRTGAGPSPPRARRSGLGGGAARCPICRRVRLGCRLRGARRPHRRRLRLNARTRRREAAWIAELDGERVGCVFCTASDAPDTAQLRLLLVEPQARGAGVGTRLVDECLRFARRAGYGESCCGPTMFWRPPAGSISGPVSSSTPRAAHEFRPRARRRVLVARPIDQAAGAAPKHALDVGLHRLQLRRPSSPSCGCRWAGS